MILKQHEKLVEGKKIMVTLVLQKEKLKKNKDNLLFKRENFHEKIMHKKKNRSLIIHGVPKSLRYETVAEKFNGGPESYKRYKASLIVTFSDRLAMAKIVEQFNSNFQFENRSLKMIPMTCETSICIQIFGVPKIMTNSETTEFLSDRLLGVKFSFRDKKKVFVEFDSVRSKLKALEKEWLECDKNKMILKKI